MNQIPTTLRHVKQCQLAFSFKILVAFRTPLDVLQWGSTIGMNLVAEKHNRIVKDNTRASESGTPSVSIVCNQYIEDGEWENLDIIILDQFYASVGMV